MNCPICGFKFDLLAVNADEIPDLSAMLCSECGSLFVQEQGQPRAATPSEILAIKESPAWKEFLEPLRDLLLKVQPPPVDRSKTMLTNGSPVTPDHRELRMDGQQKGYVVLTDEERARGWARPYRDTYTHSACGWDTAMGRKLAETYARDPKFYGATYCSHCRAHFPVSEFVWKGTHEVVGS